MFRAPRAAQRPTSIGLFATSAVLLTALTFAGSGAGGSSAGAAARPKAATPQPARSFRHAVAPQAVRIVAPRSVRPSPPRSTKPSAPRTVAAAQPWFGMLQPTTSQVTTLQASCVSKVVLSAGWDVLQPAPGALRTAAVADLVRRLTGFRAAGYSVVLDLGLQYPPSWVFSLPGQTRFVNQYGDVWRAGLSQDVPNAVFNTAVRQAQADYVSRLGKALGSGVISDVRVGGLLSGELRYPPANVNGHALSIWAYDPAAQSKAPVKGWVPGRGTATEARQSLTFYFDSLTGYLSWLMHTVDAAFPTVDQQVMLPSWGLRPGMLDASIAAGLHDTTNAEVNGLISSGLDWASQVRAMAASGARATVYTTWIDAPSQGTSTQQVPPVQYLAGLAATYGLPVAGENTGGGGRAALDLAMSRARSLHLSGLMYMSGAGLASGRSGMTESTFRQTCGTQSWAPARLP